MYYVYLLKSLIDGKYYVGHTDNLKQRLERHNKGFVVATRDRRPLVLLGEEYFNFRSEARFREYTLKNNTNERIKFYRKIDKNFIK
ncbi:MAG: Protein containing GIY-YIG catalytic domain protein [Candidatus Wolfebacteria bacterium GW2011_GWA2_42_10]|uniref:Protein containing GIY-YIG catalytic domain protein n=2 Tax=Candidatus Wolfeibacteriota TaxID=1752735 RepID=A0A0G0XLG9_9BACT|nr:MAG: Protein containing GIY-YIG catalytic domain protein [Candidatus Wolfebacteria bacterium GW2011_GWB1_41_12]KKS25302.1 MAG: Protein containing GIY-YIG catalytic domain protein [Candidatus Wolfebacteria bacterium GW2011_GWA2_42_10]KKT56741.1 MAG: Protein containing GIY-YIG catalytic domain protein [Candidatus Wolfebacteria bacterium GW2011_GWA1_44_24]